jgi:hypothetical protein
MSLGKLRKQEADKGGQLLWGIKPHDWAARVPKEARRCAAPLVKIVEA